jgi:hypothetical protein
MYYTYAYLREDRTPYYIGKGQGNRAYRRNKKDIKPPKDKGRIIYLKQNLTEEEAFKHEIYMIAVFGRIDLGTGILHNRTDGGDGTSGRVPSEETRRKIGEAHKGEKNHNYGKTFSEEYRRKISESGKGRTHSEETKRKMSEARKGKTFSEEHKRKMSEVLKGENHYLYGKTHSEETRRKMSEVRKGENHYFYGRTHSEETKRKMSEVRKGRRWWNDGLGNRKLVLECPGDGWKLGKK